MAKRFEFGKWILEIDEEIDAAYLYVNGMIPDGGVSFTNEADDDGRVNLDYDDEGRLLGVEILSDSAPLSKQEGR